MVFRKEFGWSLALLALIAARPASAALITFTGNVASDFAGVKDTVHIADPANDVAQSSWMTQGGWTSGWNMKGMSLHYDKPSDTMYVGVDFYGVAGDVDGNGNPGGADPRTLTASGVDLPNLGGRESITVGFDLNNDGVPDVVAGVPGDKSKAAGPPSIDGFTVNLYKDANNDLSMKYGASLMGTHPGKLAFDPSAANPDFEFSLKNFSTLPNFNATKGFSVIAYAGTPDDVVAGEDFIPLTHVGMPSQEPEPQQIPEPTSLLAWSLVVGGSAFGLRRRRS